MKKNCSHGPKYGEAIGDILNNPKLASKRKFNKIVKSIKENSYLFPEKINRKVKA